MTYACEQILKKHKESLKAPLENIDEYQIKVMLLEAFQEGVYEEVEKCLKDVGVSIPQDLLYIDGLGMPSYLQSVNFSVWQDRFEKQRLNKTHAFSTNDCKDLLNEQISEIL